MKQWIQEEKEKIKERGQVILDSTEKDFKKALRKKITQATGKAMKAVGLKKKTPLDKAKDMWTKIKR